MRKKINEEYFQDILLKIKKECENGGLKPYFYKRHNVPSYAQKAIAKMGFIDKNKWIAGKIESKDATLTLSYSEQFKKIHNRK